MLDPVEVKDVESTEQTAKDCSDSLTAAAPSTEEELSSILNEKATLEKQRLAEKEIRGLNKVLAECKNTAQG